MIVRESTHRVSMLSQHRATIGIRIPMLVSSLGRAWLAWCASEEREATLALLAERSDAMGAMARDSANIKRMLRETRRRGYAVNRGEWSLGANGLTSVNAIGMPIRIGEHAIGAVNLVLHSKAVSNSEIAKRYVPLLRTLADEISTGVSSAPRG